MTMKNSFEMYVNSRYRYIESDCSRSMVWLDVVIGMNCWAYVEWIQHSDQVLGACL